MKKRAKTPAKKSAKNPAKNFAVRVASPVGPILLVSNGKALSGVYVSKTKQPAAEALQMAKNDPVLKEAQKQLKEFFSGKRKNFSLPLAPNGTPFQKKVWQALQRIPYGKTISYRELAKNVGLPKAARAVGNANGRNPFCIVVPCHRVIAADGGIGGYSSGLPNKRWLLAHENKAARR